MKKINIGHFVGILEVQKKVKPGRHGKLKKNHHKKYILDNIYTNILTYLSIYRIILQVFKHYNSIVVLNISELMSSKTL